MNLRRNTKNMKLNEFSKALYVLGELFDKKISKTVLSIYYEIFQDYTVKQFNKAVYEVIRTHKYNTLPRPADIIEYLEGTKDDKALMAWMLAKRGIEIVGYYGSPEFEDPIISNCIVNLGGWQEFCSMQISNEPFIEKRFADLYRLFMKRGIDKPKVLVGFHEESNSLKGFQAHIPEIIRIGNNGEILQIVAKKEIEKLIKESSEKEKRNDRN